VGGGIALFGGSFDPPHLAHVALARAVWQSLPGAEVRWLPAGRPWQKEAARAVTSAEHRVAMVRLAIAGEARWVLDERDVQRSGPSYTIDTVDELRRERPGERLFLVLGADQHASLHTWHRWRELLAAITPAVAHRPGERARPHPEVAAVPIVELAMPASPISATAVRARAARGADISRLVPPEVAGYIARHRLYAAASRS
jgi:nicotinate-nucleotide adenylyltransferase